MGQDPTQHCHTLASRRFLARTLKCVCPVVPHGSSIVLQVCGVRVIWALPQPKLEWLGTIGLSSGPGKPGWAGVSESGRDAKLVS